MRMKIIAATAFTVIAVGSAYAGDHTASAFQSMYNSTVARAQTLGAKMTRTCWNATAHSSSYCQNAMTFVDLGWTWSAYNIDTADGQNVQEVCGAPNEHWKDRMCEFSTGVIKDQHFNGKGWDEVKTIATGFDSEETGGGQ